MTGAKHRWWHPRACAAVSCLVGFAIMAANAQVTEPSPADAHRIGICLACHSTESLDNQPRMDRRQWTRLIEKMRTDFGAPVTPDQVDELATYLATQRK